MKTRRTILIVDDHPIFRHLASCHPGDDSGHAGGRGLNSRPNMRERLLDLVMWTSPENHERTSTHPGLPRYRTRSHA